MAPVLERKSIRSDQKNSAQKESSLFGEPRIRPNPTQGFNLLQIIETSVSPVHNAQVCYFKQLLVPPPSPGRSFPFPTPVL